MSSEKKIKTALVSVYNKDNLEPIVKALYELGITIYSTGGTSTFIKELNLPVIPVEDLTEYPSILGGRVKTLHPKIFGGILARRSNLNDLMQLEEYQIPVFDLVIVDLYPFRDTVYSGASDEEIIEKIDIGGVSLIRAAAKNFNDVLVIPSVGEYNFLRELLVEYKGFTTLEQRKKMAARAFAITSVYDTEVNDYVGQNIFADKIYHLRYGENPHQKAFFAGDLEEMFDKLNGKELSYNNLLDVHAAITLLQDFKEADINGDEITCAIIKHNNACGVASRPTAIEAWKAALAGDPVSAFGGIIIVNGHVDEATAEEMHKIFFEILIADSFDQSAIDCLKEKKNRILLQVKEIIFATKEFRSLLNGEIQQDVDLKVETANDLNLVTNREPFEPQIADMLFANKIVKHSKSNAIVLAKNKQLLASGIGQTSRVDALNQAIEKAKRFNFDLQNAVMASDAFFPFPDCVEIAHKAGITAVIQPGGSVKDKDSIDYCNKNNLAMVFTGIRHFKH